MKVTSKVEQDFLKVYFDGTLHISLYLGDLLAYQSWVESESWYMIEYVFKGAKMKSMYSDVKLWKDVLLELENHF